MTRRESMIISREMVAKMFDLSCVRSDHQESEFVTMVEVAKKYGIFAVFALPAHTVRIKELIQDAQIKLGGVCGFPSGSTTTSIKLAEVAELEKIGIDELDMVINITWLRSGLYERALSEVRAVRDAAHGIPIKLILEVTSLNEEQIRRGCEIGIQAGVDFIKTGTGWMPDPTALRHVEIIADAVKGRCKIKAAGGVRDRATVQAMLGAGVSRFGIGSKAAVAILSDWSPGDHQDG
jgi:deoxyribose-phosphate aldolase